MAEGDEQFPEGESIAALPGDVGIASVPDDELVTLPGDLPPGQIPEIPTPRHPLPDDDELRIALERARMIADELSSVLRPVTQALHDGAWVSRRADEFSLELDDGIRHLATIGDRSVEAIEALAQQGRPGDGEFELLPHHPQVGSISAYGAESGS